MTNNTDDGLLPNVNHLLLHHWQKQKAAVLELGRLDDAYELGFKAAWNFKYRHTLQYEALRQIKEITGRAMDMGEDDNGIVVKCFGISFNALNQRLVPNKEQSL